MSTQYHRGHCKENAETLLQQHFYQFTGNVVVILKRLCQLAERVIKII